MTLRNFDIFEKFPNGSMTGRTCVFGTFEAERKLHELTEHSNSEFLAIDIQSVERLSIGVHQISQQAIKKAANG
jgi:hypothetical protein